MVKRADIEDVRNVWRCICTWREQRQPFPLRRNNRVKRQAGRQTEIHRHKHKHKHRPKHRPKQRPKQRHRHRLTFVFAAELECGENMCFCRLFVVAKCNPHTTVKQQSDTRVSAGKEGERGTMHAYDVSVF